MKYSKSVLLEGDFQKKIFEKGVEKCKEFLTDIFGVDFNENDEKITNVLEDFENKTFEVWLCLGKRTIFVSFAYEEDDDDFIQEILTIEETNSENVSVNNIPSDYTKAVNHVMDLLEEKYELEFTPLDQSEKDENIKTVYNQPNENIMEVIFTHEDHEATFKAVFRFVGSGESSLNVEQFKKHIIYLD